MARIPRQKKITCNSHTVQAAMSIHGRCCIQSTLYCLFSTYTLSSAFRFALTRGYATENRPQADVLEVNQSPEKRKQVIVTTIIDSSNVASLYLSLLLGNSRHSYAKMICKVRITQNQYMSYSQQPHNSVAEKLEALDLVFELHLYYFLQNDKITTVE